MNMTSSAISHIDKFDIAFQVRIWNVGMKANRRFQHSLNSPRVSFDFILIF